MNLKIKTNDIEIEYKDEYSMIEEPVKKRILEISETVLSHQLSIEQVRAEQQELDLKFEGEDEEEYAKAVEENTYHTYTNPNLNDPMWFSKANDGSLTKDFFEGYSQAVYQIRLYLSNLKQEPLGIRSYTSTMLNALSEAKWKQDSDAWDGQSPIEQNRTTANLKPTDTLTR